MRALNAFSHVEMMLFVLKLAPDRIPKSSLISRSPNFQANTCKHIPNLIREYVKCENNCPCYDNCFDGCPCSYETEYCDIPDECKVDEKNTAEFGKCDQFNRSQFLYCTDNCEIYDTDCFHDCSVNFEEGNEARIVNTSV